MTRSQNVDLLKNGTKVKMYNGGIGVIKGNDWDENRDWGFNNVNYYVYPIGDDTNYEMMLRQDIELVDDVYMEKLKKIEEAIKQALKQYSKENVDIVADEESGMIYIMYHSGHNSFPIISDVCSLDGLSVSDIDKMADYYDIGYCW